MLDSNRKGKKMRTREKVRIWRRFIAGESLVDLSSNWGRTVYIEPWIIENVLREGLDGKFDKDIKGIHERRPIGTKSNASNQGLPRRAAIACI
jgi:hypothetical protein